MIRWLFLLLLGIAPFFVFGSTTFQTIYVKILPATSIVITGEDPNFEVITEPLLPGETRITQFRTGISYSLVCSDGCTKKIIAQLDNEMPEGTKIRVYMAPPSGATTTGFQTLGPVEKDMVLHIDGNAIVKNSAIIYEIEVNSKVTSIPAFSRNVVYTLIDE